MSEVGQGLWLYAVARDVPRDALITSRGVADGPVHCLDCDGLSAVVSPVDLAEFGAEALRHHLEDLDWLAATARAHDAVVTATHRAVAATVPMRLATVFLGDDRVRDLVVHHRAELEAALEALTGRAEWGVKVYADPDELERAGAGTTPGTSAPGSGAAYLRRRRAQLSAREDAERTAATHAGRVHDGCAGAAAAAVRHPPQDPRLSGRREWMVLNGAYLVDHDRARRFADTVADLDAGIPGVRVELTGPWPPYSFAGLELATADKVGS